MTTTRWPVFSAVAPGVAFVATLPPADDRLYGPDRFGAGWLVAAVVALLVAVCGLLWAVWPRKMPRIEPEIEHVLGLRERYLVRLDELERQVVADELSPRALHHELSRVLRSFASELGTPRALSMSAGALDEAGQRKVAAAVRHNVHPQFEERPASNPATAIEIARAVVTEASNDGDDQGPAR